MRFVNLLFAAATLLHTSCGAAHPTAADKQQHVRVAAAANLRFALEDIVEAFHSTHPNVKVVVTYGSSGNFFAQLSNQAPFDVFLSADVEYPRQLIEQGKSPSSELLIYGVGRIVLWSADTSTLDITQLGLKALLDPSVRKIAIANPKHAPYGRAAVAALQHESVFTQIQDRLVYGDNVEQTAQFVESGSADVGIIPLALAKSPVLIAKGRFFVIPPEYHPRLEQGGIVLSWARDGEAADAFRRFLLGDAGRSIFISYGYETP